MDPVASGKKMLPIGEENFAKLIQDGYYYVDKTGMIAELLRERAKVTLFTRPRRFGKSLNMSMLKAFFGIGEDPSVFDGLAISKERELCERYMGKFPVISLSLKDVGAADHEGARRMLCSEIGLEALRFGFLSDSERLDEREKEAYRQLTRIGGAGEPQFPMSDEVMVNGLLLLSALLEKHYGRKVILLIDEYDVPLQRAFYGGYYDQMAGLIRGMFSKALKTNDSLEFAVLTGCLRISKESIFTGVNNLKVFSIMDTKYAGCFGFTDREVQDLMEYYGLTDHYERAREWYDGYRFGGTEIYCPWDVVNYCFDLCADPGLIPQDYWTNSSGNDVIREFVRRMDTGSARQELQVLVDGGTIGKRIRQEMTYRDMYGTVENLWSLLYMTGYLTGTAGEVSGEVLLRIPNWEIRDIFATQIMELFREETKKDGESLRRLCDALASGDAAGVESAFAGYLRRTISIRDTSVRELRKENFYQGILMGILSYKADWIVRSSRETGEGYGDILVEAEDGSLGIVIETKYAQDGDLEKSAGQALAQIRERRYDEALYDDGIEKVLRYGIACYKKRCKVALAEE